VGVLSQDVSLLSLRLVVDSLDNPNPIFWASFGSLSWVGGARHVLFAIRLLAQVLGPTFMGFPRLRPMFHQISQKFILFDTGDFFAHLAILPLDFSVIFFLTVFPNLLFAASLNFLRFILFSCRCSPGEVLFFSGAFFLCVMLSAFLNHPLKV